MLLCFMLCDYELSSLPVPLRKLKHMTTCEKQREWQGGLTLDVGLMLKKGRESKKCACMCGRVSVKAAEGA